MVKEGYDKEEVMQRLRAGVEKRLGFGLRTPADFSQAVAEIAAKTGRPISATTLMRIWGYVRDGGESYSPGLYSLSTLAIFLGYLDFGRFATDGPAYDDVQSEGYAGKCVAAESMPSGTSVVIEWEPDRRCVLKHLEGFRFEVVQAVNSRIQVGDIVECASFTQDAPLYCNNVWRGGKPLMTYMAGSRTGIRYRVVEDEAD